MTHKQNWTSCESVFLLTVLDWTGFQILARPLLRWPTMGGLPTYLPWFSHPTFALSIRYHSLRWFLDRSSSIAAYCRHRHPIDDLNNDRSLCMMNVIANHTVCGASNPPLQSRQTSEGTSQHAIIVTQAYEPHPTMTNPLSFSHQQPQCTLYSQSPPNSQCDGLSSKSGNQNVNIWPQCMLAKSQDQPRCVPRIVVHCRMVSSSHFRLLRTIPKLPTA